MQNQYEVVLIYTPVLSADQLKAAIDEFKGILKEHKAKVVHDESWGMRKLAYPIAKKSTGFYYICEFKVEGGEIINPIELALKRDERLLRFMTVRLDKDSIAYSIKRIAKLKDKAKAKPVVTEEKEEETK
ncbi:MAG: small subunit ribosomal protein S6 [Sphingobacteriales bacterium]|jgi:small subunit ribosomal protein S6